MWGFLIAILSGALMSIQGVFNSGVTKQTSVWSAAAFVQLSALLVCIIAWFVTGKECSFADVLRVSPKYILLGGAIGAFITITVVKSIDALGTAKAEMFIVFSQMLVAYIIELFGLFGMEKTNFEWKKLLGIALFLAGIVVFKWQK